jgi:hypothetical protein
MIAMVETEEGCVGDMTQSGEVSFLSPSFRSASERGGAAFEVKFLLDEQQALEVRSWARSHLLPDPHGIPELQGAYLTHSLYSDTESADVYWRRSGFERRKYRVRRYGSEDWVSLERKSRVGQRVAKRRAIVALADLARLRQSLGDANWSGQWFVRRLSKSRLRPICQVTYLREAYAGQQEGPVRLTMDRDLQGLMQPEWQFVPPLGSRPLLANQVILELKYRSIMPTAFKQLLTDLCLSPAAVSKYRRCREAWDPSLLSRGSSDA